MKFRLLLSTCFAVAAVSCGLVAHAANPNSKVWTSAGDKTLPASFAVQGEYATPAENEDQFGCQVIALGGDAFHAVVYPGGLPGAGWDGVSRSLMAGELKQDKTLFKAADGKRQYLAKSPSDFSATKKFPPAGHQPYSATISNSTMTLLGPDGKTHTLDRTVRVSPTMGKKPGADATVLFDGSDTKNWQGGRLDEETKLLNTDGKDIRTKSKFSNYTMHVEFMLPYRPDARGQGRGNSGFYQVDHYEVQILDSFGLEGLNNECGGVYTKAAPKVNMCLPPLTWQTYDVEFTNAVTDANGKKVKNARMTLSHNGVVIHEDLEINGRTGGSRNEPEGTPGVIKLQGHGNPLQYRNVWIEEKK